MILTMLKQFSIQTFNGHCLALKTGLEYITYHVPVTFTVVKDFFPAQLNGEELAPTLMDYKGPTILICYKQIFVVANI